MHSHKKQKDSLEILAVLLIFLLELEINGVAVQNPKQSNIFDITTSFLNLKLQIIRLAQGYWSSTPTQ